MKNYRHIHIQSLGRGFKVDVGCKKMVFLDTPDEHDNMCAWLKKYLEDPRAAEIAYEEKFGYEDGPTCDPVENVTDNDFINNEAGASISSSKSSSSINSRSTLKKEIPR